MNRHSFISSFDARRYLVVVTVATLLGLGLLGATIHGAFKHGILTNRDEALINHRLAKAARPEPLDVVIVGDSSAGNGIDDAVLSTILGSSVANLALTGSYGLEGSLNMALRSLHTGARTVIVVQTPETGIRGGAPAGHIRTARRLTDLEPLTAWEWTQGIWQIAKTRVRARIITAALSERLLAPGKAHMSHDYIVQGDRLDAEALNRYVGVVSISPQQINPVFGQRLQWIANTCMREELTCIYAHGPIYAGFCQTWRPYIDAMNQVIKASGLRLAAEQPLCVPAEHMGDTFDHVHPQAKAWATAAYGRILAPVLAK